MKRDGTLDFARCVMNYMIVAMHAWAAFQYVDRTTAEFAGWTFICEFVCAMAMPTFFMISGNLMFRNFAWQSLPDKLGRRVRRLVVPYLVWNVTFVVFYLAVSRAVPRLAARVSTYGLDSWAGSLSKIASFTVSPIDGPLWFLRAIACLAVLSPMLWLALRFLKGVPVVLLAVGWCYGEWHLGFRAKLEFLFPSYAIVCYLLGAWAAVYGRELASFFGRWGWLALGFGACAFRGWLLVPVFLGKTVPEWANLTGTYLRILEAPALIALVSLLGLGQGQLVQSKAYRYLKDMSFFAYAGHFLFCSVFLHVIAPKFGFMTTGKMSVLVLVFVGLGVPTMAVVYGLARKACPTILRLWDGTL